MDITKYNNKYLPMTDPVKAQIRSPQTGKLWVFGSPGAWASPASVSQEVTLLAIAPKDSKSNHWTVPIPEALVSGNERFVDLLLYDGADYTAIALGGILDLKTGHYYDASWLPLDNVNRVVINEGPV